MIDSGGLITPRHASLPFVHLSAARLEKFPSNIDKFLQSTDFLAGNDNAKCLGRAKPVIAWLLLQHELVSSLIKISLRLADITHVRIIS